MKLIDINEISGRKLSKLLVWLLRKILKLDEINAIIAKNDGKDGIAFAEAVLDEFDIETYISGVENIPMDEPLIFASNHPLGALEALAMGKYLDRVFPDRVRFITNEILSYIPPLRDIFVSVAVGRGMQEKSSVEKLDELFTSDNQIVMFPSGVVSRLNGDRVEDPEWKKMFVKKARDYNRRVVLIHCTGQSSNFFLKLSNLRKRLGIKVNIEMLFFPREMFGYAGKKIEVSILDTVSVTDEKFAGMTDHQIAQELRRMVYEAK